MESTYDPKITEASWYQAWEQAGIFKPEYRPDGEPFIVVIPPPNVTGVLHLGHALNHSIHDMVVRRKRMQGYAAVWIPGTDHAGIATQNIVERQLADEGMNRHDIGREAFIEQVWIWKRQSGGTISRQMRRLGDSCDWSRERFTMDEGLSAAVREVFVRLYEEDLMYRGNRIINWCPRCETALAEIEVEFEEEAGELVHIAYPFTDGSGSITVATTRAETMLGDTAVAVHPDDERYKSAIGKTLTLPLVGRQIPVIADEAVEMDFGTGAVKVTPAHDPTDFEIGQRHDLESITIFDRQAVVNEAGGSFSGLGRFAARVAVKEALKAEGALVAVEERRHPVGHCYRCHTIIEPILSLQWFVRVKPLVGPAIDAVRDGESRFIPQRWENSYFHWMENLRDWCVSRQIWWGHRIPAWYCDECEEVIVAREDPTSCPSCGHSELAQDEDVLDTWFSSALWPFSTLGWPEQTEDLERFYPNSVMITGFDIIYFWVARMLKMGIHFLGEVPFPDIIIHGLVRTADGAKMSKSVGNAVDPMDVIAEHGADALRLALLQAASPGQDVPLDDEWIRAARKFGNKLWNATAFALMNLDESVPSDGYPTPSHPVNRWVLSRLQAVVERYDELCDDYRLADALSLLYSFTWSEVFDWYLEMSKPLLRADAHRLETQATLGAVMRDILRLFHPAIPYLTEELWSELVGVGLLAGADWPVVPAVQAPPNVEVLMELVSSVRRFRSGHQLSPRNPIELLVLDTDHLVDDWWEDQFSALVNVSIKPISAPQGSGYTRLLAGSIQGFIGLAGLIDVDAEAQRIRKTMADAEVELMKASKKLSNQGFLAKAPDDVVAKEQAKADEAQAMIDKLTAQLEEIGQ
ncbi:MAG: valine--tRNA ligase [Acidimicrobiia bacterium]|nr:valine--tRNA ligase [Acidimicrobiia bacterium]MDH5503426.1 valine--tRNA ligase [Acidimicrobiia bacterium]